MAKKIIKRTSENNKTSELAKFHIEIDESIATPFSVNILGKYLTPKLF